MTISAGESPELLDVELIQSRLGPVAQQHLAGLQLVAEIDSTNAELLRRPPAARHAFALLAEMQHSGRGRRGRQWQSPFARNIYLSLGWRFAQGMAALGCLPLVVALAAATAVRRLGAQGIGIKWPNDLVAGDAKLGGCLVEMQGDAQGPCHAVLGVGLNVFMMNCAEDHSIDRPWTDLAALLPDSSRNQVAAVLLDELLNQVAQFDRDGFQPFRPAWDKFDVLQGRAVTVYHGQDERRGMACGIGPQGGLLLDQAGQVRELLAGEVTLSAAGRSKPE
jgi:BirA family biotin operon repressor/biotin-[acetyl-CoA-carboxylase] ligase